MKLVAIAGSIADHSYNRMLLEFMARQYAGLVDIELLNINDIPIFNQSQDASNSEPIQYLNQKILTADGVILATPEHNHTITAALKSVIEWLSFKLHPFDNKPVMIIGASYYSQGSSRAQLMLRQILESPGVNAMVMPGNEFLLGDVKDAFDANDNLKDAKTIDFLGNDLKKFLKFVKVVKLLDAPDTLQPVEEDLSASGKIKTTVDGVTMTDPDWVEQAAAKTHAASGSDYVQLDRGLLTVDQLNMFLNNMPMELTYADANNQFIYYNKMLDTKQMLAPRRPEQVGDPLANVHPPRAFKGVKATISALRSGKTDLVRMPVPGNGPDKYIMHYYKAMHDDNGDYAGINEWVLDLMPTIKWYLQKTGQMLVPDPNASTDATTGASQSGSASPAPTTDADTGASAHDETPAPAPTTDADTGASQS